ncbi:NHL repeat-containing protein [Thioploca ingrica]|uniref:non-specific serine/threonine protein kinase n=1 Tax=Thioploca ingrica TaxID=40754 RepID=A0A090AG11_9GAMM|nr:NHL repeat-containing protein [Thioploca ingrica]
MTLVRFLLLLLPFCVWTSFVQAEGIISTVAGTGTAGYDGEGVATSKMLNLPAGVAVDSTGNLYIADWQNHRIRKVDSVGNITTVAGTGAAGHDGEGIAISKMLNLPRDVAVDSAGNLYIADAGNYRIRKVDGAGNMTTVAGTGTAGYDGEGMATSKMLANPLGIAVDSAGNLYIADTNNNRIRKVDSTGNMTTVAGIGIAGYDGEGMAISKKLNLPRDVAVDSAGNLYIADSMNYRIRKVDNLGNMTTVAGTGTAGYDGEGIATSKMLADPSSVAVDSTDNLYIADRQKNYRIRKVDSAGNMTTVAGTGTAGYDGEGVATNKMLNEPNGVAVDSVGNLYVADKNNYRIRKVVFNTTPVANNVSISLSPTGTPTFKVDETLQGNYTYSDTEKDPEGISTFQWYTATDATCTTEKTAIFGATSQTYTLTSSEVDKYLCFEVTPVAASGASPGTAVLTTSSSTVSNISAVSKIDQTITFAALADKTDGDAPFTVSATATSRLPIGFSSTGNCTVTDTIVTLTGVGSCTITASQAGDATYNAAIDVVQTFTITAKKVTLTVSKSGTGNGIITSLPAGIDCGVSCRANFNAATLVTLTAQAAAGSKFVGFSGNEDCGDGNLTLNVNKTCNAIFELLPTTPVVENRVFSLKVTGNGRVISTPAGVNCSHTCEATFVSGTHINLTAKPAKDFKFAGFSGSACTEGDLTLNTSIQCEATFVPVLPGTAQFSASHYEVTAGRGTVGVIVKRAGGTDGTLIVNYATQDDTAKAGRDYVVANGSLTWAEGESDDKLIIITLLDDPMITDAEEVFAIQLTDASNKTLDTAKFSLLEKHPIPATLTVTLVGQGKVSSDPVGIDCSQCTHDFDTGTQVILTAVPESGWQLAKWQGDCDQNGQVSLDKDKQCEAVLVRTASLSSPPLLTTLLPLTVTLVGQGKVISTPAGIDCRNSCQAMFEPNTAITLTTVPESGWQLAKWQGDCDANGLVIMAKEKQCEAIFVTIKPDTSGVPLTPPSNTNPSIAPAIYSNVSNEEVPQLVVNPGFYNFGHLPVGNLSPAQEITITNAGHADLQLGQLTVSSNEFILAETCSHQTLSAGNHCTATVSFQPQLAGVKTAYLAIPLDNPKQATVTVVTLTGKGNAIRKQTHLTRDIKYLIENNTIDLPQVTFMSPLAAVETSVGKVSTVTNCVQIPQIECEALIALYNSTGGPNWINHARWNTNNAPCGNGRAPWYGIVCDNNHGHVTEIFLSGNQLSGPIPPELGNLSELRILGLFENQLSGPIPPELGNLTHLESLNLFSNKLSGSIPSELGNLSHLENLGLSENQLSGPIPSELGNLSYLYELYLSNNQLSGSIPPELSNLSHLEVLGLWSNQLSGLIPPKLGNLSNLVYLYLDDNLLSGSIPPELGNLSHLQSLWLWKNQLSGSIPPEFGNLRNLKELVLFSNQLSGPIPPKLGNLSNLVYLFLDDNLLSGLIPTELSNLSHLEDLWLSENQLCDNLEPALKAFLDSHHATWQPQNPVPADCALPAPANYPPLLATLAYFEAKPVSTSILLKWQTLVEADNAGFVIWRGQPNGSQCAHHLADYHEIVQIGFEISQGNGFSGTTYVHQDNTVKPETTYCYLLEDLNFEANGTFYWDSIASVTTP